MISSTAKAVDPVWYVPQSVRKEHAEMGDPLPSVVPAGPDQKPVAVNELGEAVLSTPAIAGGRLLIRAENHLFAIGATRK